MNIKSVVKLLIVFVAINACTTSNEEDLLPDDYCDAENVNYSEVNTILNTYGCIGCHDSGFTNKEGIVLDSYESVKASINTNLFIGAIKQLDDFAAMPVGSDKMSDCDIVKIEAWVNADMPQ